jgi:hypothetical protein
MEFGQYQKPLDDFINFEAWIDSSEPFQWLPFQIITKNILNNKKNLLEIQFMHKYIF